MYGQYDYEFINNYNGGRSATGKVEYDYNTAYFMRALWQRVISVIDFKLPKTWNMQYFKNVLFRNGFIGIIDTPKYGIIPQVCTLKGYGLYLQPTEIMVAQPLVNFSGTIGENCELIKLTPDYIGIWDIVEHYARQCSTCYTSINVALENSRLAYLLLGKNKQACETLKVIAERISAGESLIVVDKVLTDELNGDSLFFETHDVKNSYIVDKLLSDLTTIINSFDNEIGIATVDSKKERYISDEVEAQTSDSCARISTWKTCLEESFANVNNLFTDINISFKLKGGVNNGLSQIDSDRNV